MRTDLLSLTLFSSSILVSHVPRTTSVHSLCPRPTDSSLTCCSLIQQKAEEHWESLPPQFRLQGSLKQCAQSSFSRDFLAHVRLNHLHVLFLLRLLLLNTPSEPDNHIVQTAGQMLALVVELILLRDQLTNSGTGLIWKVRNLWLPTPRFA